MITYVCAPGFEENLLHKLEADHQVFGPVRGGDDVCRLQPLKCWSEMETGRMPLIPAKKFLLPPRQVLWNLAGDTYRSPSAPPPVALVGLFPCDLHALAYLDEVFTEDALYAARRKRLFLMGIACSAGPECFCPPASAPPPFDLFFEGGRVWTGSAKGAAYAEDLLDQSSCTERPPPSCLIEGVGSALPGDLEERFAESSQLPVWRDVGERCLSCGACSAVCPTCYCYDVLDEALPDESVARLREWDNCFFRDHGLVAGGHNFRPSRTERLRFRFEHKLLGFGALRGVSSCVGCGRCGRACPVDIDIADVLKRLLDWSAP